MTTIYLDHNATTPLDDGARAAMSAAMDVLGNPSSVHGAGRAARRIVEDAREGVAALVGVDPARVIFTGGGTEANNLALRGTAATRVLASAVEHPSVLKARDDIDIVPVDENGVLDLAALERMLGADGADALVSVMAANNETGVLQPIAAVAEIVRKAGARLHVDAVQAAGKMPLDGFSGADMLTLSAHKFGGPAGVGALIVVDGLPLQPIVRGGGQERRRRAGTENVVGIAGMGAAASRARAHAETFADFAANRDMLERDLIAAGGMVYGQGAPRLANTLTVGMPGVSAETQVMAFDLAGIAVSAGSACSSGKVEPSHVLLAMGIDGAEAAQAIRVSFGQGNTMDDARRFLRVWNDIRGRAGSSAAA